MISDSDSLNLFWKKNKPGISQKSIISFLTKFFNRRFEKNSQSLFYQFGHKRCRHRLGMGDKRPPSGK